MSCNLENELTAWVDGELSPQAAATVRTHLAGCADCRATEALLRRTVLTLEALPAFEPSLSMRREVLHQLDAARPLAERLRALLRPGVLVPSAAGLLAAGAVAVLLVSPNSNARLPSELQEGAALDVAMNYEVASDYEVLGLESPDDVEVVAQLQELEGRP